MLRSGGEYAPESINQEQYRRSNIEEEARFGGAGGGQQPQEAGGPSGQICSRARLLEDAIRRADSEARQVRGESEGRRSSKSAKRAQDAALVDAQRIHRELRHAGGAIHWTVRGAPHGLEQLTQESRPTRNIAPLFGLWRHLTATPCN